MEKEKMTLLEAYRFLRTLTLNEGKKHLKNRISIREKFHDEMSGEDIELKKWGEEYIDNLKLAIDTIQKDEDRYLEKLTHIKNKKTSDLYDEIVK